VHAYARLDLARVHAIAGTASTDLRAFLGHYETSPTDLAPPPTPPGPWWGAPQDGAGPGGLQTRGRGLRGALRGVEEIQVARDRVVEVILGVDAGPVVAVSPVPVPIAVVDLAQLPAGGGEFDGLLFSLLGPRRRG
jgi:hypothetical protein